MANPKSTVAPKVHRLSFGMICCLFRYSKMQCTSSWLWGFNSLFLRLLGEISLSLLCSHSSWGSALGLAPPLRVGHPLASFLHSDKRGFKQRLFRGLLFPQAVGREGYCSHNWNAGWACSGRGWRDVATAWGMPCVLPGNLSLDHGPLAVAGCTGSWRGAGVFG